jgi:hypothetical protein
MEDLIEEHYLLKKNKDGLFYSPLRILDKNSFTNNFNKIQLQILSTLSKKAMYPAQLAKKLNLHEQKIYYHIKPLIKNNIIDVKEKKEIRGTTAKLFYLPYKNIGLSFLDDLSNKEVNISNWNYFNNLQNVNFSNNNLQNIKNNHLLDFFNPLITSSTNSSINSSINSPTSSIKMPSVDEINFNGYFVVGSPDPHGEFKAYARDGHYAIDLALFLGKFISFPENFSVILDVDIKEHKENNLLLFGGPVTNTLVSSVNNFLPVKFVYSNIWGLKNSKTGKEYVDDTIGLIVKIPNPYNEKNSLFILAGIRSIGTKACVLAITRFFDKVFQNYNGQKTWHTIVQGFDLDGDGKIDSIDILE